jgi:4-hydroxy-4-methyl-2-oxoglutarate aldolase
MGAPLSPEVLEALQSLDTCSVSNAIEILGDRLRNEGFTSPAIRRITGDGHCALVGHAVTVRIHCSRPPALGRTYEDRTDWWNYILSVPAPRVVVIEDVDSRPGTGTFLGEVHANILRALGCVGGVTNGVVRDVPAIEEMGFQLFASGMAVSHAYAHIVDFGHPVHIAGLPIHSGNLLHGDMHGVLCVPQGLAAAIPGAVAKIRTHERQLIELCRSPEFSVEKLRQAVTSL